MKKFLHKNKDWLRTMNFNTVQLHIDTLRWHHKAFERIISLHDLVNIDTHHLSGIFTSVMVDALHVDDTFTYNRSEIALTPKYRLNKYRNYFYGMDKC